MQRFILCSGSSFRAADREEANFHMLREQDTMTKKKLLAVIYALEKFWPNILGSKIIIYINHAAIKYLLSKKEAKARQI